MCKLNSEKDDDAKWRNIVYLTGNSESNGDDLSCEEGFDVF
jgi:hypothetical protein